MRSDAEFQPPLIEGRCNKTDSDVLPPKLGTVGGQPAATSKPAAPVFGYAILEIEIIDFDPAYPAEIKTFDDTYGTATQPLETITFAPHTSAPCPPLRTLKVPVFLAYDSDPWSRPNKEPEARTTRIELHHSSMAQPLTAYAQLKDGIFVVPVYWHNVIDSGSRSYVDPLHVMQLFWTAPSGSYDDVNSIWAQAGVQFRLMNTGIPFHVGSIPTHVVDPSERSSASGCQLGWNQNYDSNTGVDIYTVQSLSSVGGLGNPPGIGNCFGQGHVLIKAANPGIAEPGFTGPLWTPGGRAELVAHEFGHYLASLPHKDSWNSLMHSGLGGWGLDQSQIELARERIKGRGTYNESA